MYGSVAIIARKYTAAMNAPANESHLSCWRSTPVERRSLMTRLTAHASMQKGIGTIASWSGSRIGLSAVIANGFGIVAGSWMPVVTGPAANRIAIEATAIEHPESHASHRHRGDGRCPSGNSRIRNVPVRPTAGTHVHWLNATIQFAAGSQVTV